MQQAAAQAYAKTAQQTVHPRELEAIALTKAASRLQAAVELEDMSREDWVATLRYNRQLWILFATSVTRPDNPLPDEVKANIANLAIFIFKQSLVAERDRTEASVRPLISINRNIAAGLRGQ